MEKNSKIFVTGHKGLVGSAVVRELKIQGYADIITIDKNDCNLWNQPAVAYFFSKNKPEYVINCAGKVGGINANNTQSADFITENIQIQTNIIQACHEFKVKKLLFLGSSCIYPKMCPQPIKEEYLLTSALEETNIGYAIAKISGIISCRLHNKQYGDNFISAMPTNLYGINDNFNLMNSHVLPALIRKFHDAKINNLPSVEFWGTGSARREFLFVDDLAQALVFLMNNYDNCNEHINIGCGDDVTILELAEMLKKITKYEGEIIWNSEYPDGTPVKRLDVTKINNLGWKAKTSLEAGLQITYDWFVKNYNTIRK